MSQKSGPPGPAADRVVAAQVAAMFSTAPIAMPFGYLSALLVAVIWVYAYDLPLWRAALWAALHSATYFPRELLAMFYWRDSARDLNWRRWARWFTVFVLLGGAVWGCGAIYLIRPSSFDEQVLLVLVLLALGSGSVLAFEAYLPAVYAHLLPLALPMISFSAGWADSFHYAFVPLSMVYLVAISALGWRSNRTLARSMRHDLQKRDLIHELGAQKERAEQADRAKSRFLAAASHDLRQPIHALGMFLAALQERRLDAESARLVEEMSGSAKSIDGLFSSLLDISRLDADVVHANFRIGRVQQLIDRVMRDFKLEAEKKGLTLKTANCSAWVRTDPVLLETVLRNLVSNAVRYTERGSVLIGCRRGARLRIDVLDTGRGIASEEIDRIFEEFYQAGDRERDRKEGLGLGLAIVKRLASLLDAEVEVASTPGKGSRFSLYVPLAGATPTLAPPNPSDDLADDRADDAALVFVVDDEAPIRNSMSALLSSWGHDVVVAGSGYEILKLAAADARRPDFLICDLRLLGGESGLDVIDRLREEYNADIPAVVMTGDTATGAFATGEREMCTLLFKPVPPAKLRTALRSALAAGRSPRAEEERSQAL